MTDQTSIVFNIIANVLGIEVSEINHEADFSLDFNATAKDMDDIKLAIESALEVVLPEFDEEIPLTVGDLMELVEDSLL